MSMVRFILRKTKHSPVSPQISRTEYQTQWEEIHVELKGKSNGADKFNEARPLAEDGEGFVVSKGEGNDGRWTIVPMPPRLIP